MKGAGPEPKVIDDQWLNASLRAAPVRHSLPSTIVQMEEAKGVHHHIPKVLQAFTVSRAIVTVEHPLCISAHSSYLATYGSIVYTETDWSLSGGSVGGC